jgi:hypothetical protein
MGHWLEHILGMDNLSGPVYGFWSGFGSDISELSLVGVMGAHLRAANCEVHGCWRIGRHLSAAGHRLCRRHHPDDALTEQAAVEAHQQAVADSATQSTSTPGA